MDLNKLEAAIDTAIKKAKIECGKTYDFNIDYIRGFIDGLSEAKAAIIEEAEKSHDF